MTAMMKMSSPSWPPSIPLTISPFPPPPLTSRLPLFFLLPSAEPPFARMNRISDLADTPVQLSLLSPLHQPLTLPAQSSSKGIHSLQMLT